MSSKVNFQFYNAITPRYIEPIFLKLEIGEWYSVKDLVLLLQQDLQINGSDVVQRCVDAWASVGLGEIVLKKEGRVKRVYFQIFPLGKYLQEFYSTNNELFFDLMHYFFYSTWIKNKQDRKLRFWVYAQVCNDLWINMPPKMATFSLTSKIQTLALETFPDYSPSISERSISAVFPWITKLSPPFLEKVGTKSDLSCKRRNYCTPQLFHLAIDLLYAQKQLSYGTSLNVDDEIIKNISMTCLLDPDRFWEMAERTQIMVKGFEVKKSQWGPTMSLNHAPSWIELPAFQSQEVESSDEELTNGES